MSTHAPLLRLDTLSFSATTTSPTPHPPLQPPHNNMACMCWLPVENLKQLTVSPLRPGRCPSTAACIKTHKKPAPFSTFFLHRTRHPLPTPPTPPHVSAGYHSNPSRSLSLSVDLHTDVSTIKARLLLSRVASRGSYSPFLHHFFFWRLEVLFRGGLAQGGCHKILTVCFMCSRHHPHLSWHSPLSVYVCSVK